MKLSIVKAVLLFLLGDVTKSKVVTCTPDLTVNMNNRWQYCTKMAFAKDRYAKVKASVEFADGHKTDKPNHVQLFVFTEDQWDTILRNEERAEGRVTCEKISNLAEYKDFVYFDNGQGKINQTDFQNYVQYKSQIWYFVIADCKKMTMNVADDSDSASEGTPKIKFSQKPFTMTLELLNGDSHFSEEESGFALTLMIFSAVILGVAATNVYNARKDKSEYERIDNPLYVTLLAITQLANKSMCQLVHMLMYWYYGYGWLIFRIQFTLSGLMSQASLSVLFLVLAFGYGTVQKKVEINDFLEYRWLGLGTLAAHLIIGVLILLDHYHEERHRWHDYHGIHGELLYYVRIGLYALFCRGLQKTWQLTQNDATLIVDQDGHKKFIIWLFIIGTVYFLSLPLSVWFADATIPGPAQQSFILLSVYVSQIITILVFLYWFIPRDSLYCRLSFKREKQGLASGAAVSSSFAEINKLN